MPAPSIATLLNIPPHVQEGLQQRLAARMPYLDVLRPREKDDIPAYSLRIAFGLGPALDHLRPMPDGTFQRDAWNYVLKIGIHTQRDKSVEDLNGKMRGDVMAIITAARYDPAFLPWYVLSTMKEQSVTESLDAGEDMDVSFLQWAGIICIRPDAWPV